MLDALRQEDEAARADVEPLATAAERCLAFEDVEHLVLCRVDMVGRLLALAGDVLGDRRARARAELGGLEGEVDPDVADRTLAAGQGDPRAPARHPGRRPGGCG